MTVAVQLLFALAFFGVWLWVGRQLALLIPATRRLQSVSWDGGVVLALAVFQLFVLPTLTAEVLVAAGKLKRGQDLQITTSLLVGNGISYAIAVAVGMWVLRSMTGATKRQLGIDRLYLRLPRDAGWGLVAWLFALPPTYVLQVPLVRSRASGIP